ncbi:MAG: nitroreductase family protein [bacterium]
MDVLQAIRDRRSVRRFTDQPVAREQLQAILEAARWAPSWVNLQPCRIIIVEDPKKKEALKGTLLPSNPAAKGFDQAPVLIVLAAERGKSGLYGNTAATDKGDWYMFDAGLAAQNMALAAHALGFGTVHVGAMNHKEAARILEVPEGFEVIEILPLGVPAHPAKAPPRKELSELVTFESFSGGKWPGK